jgi:hypothetical protein
MSSGGDHGGGIVLRHRERLAARKQFTRPDIAAKAIARRHELAERVANGATPREAGQEMGLNAEVVRQMWAKICRDLGESVLP